MWSLQLTLLMVAPARAATWTVSASGGAHYTSIQAALDGASSGDRIEVAPGTYAEALDFEGLEVEVVATGAASETVIDASAVGAFAVSFQTGEGTGTVLEGFTLRNSGGVGLRIVSASPTLKELVLEGLGGVGDLGGGAYVEGGSPTFEDCTFYDNAGALGGHLYVTGYASVTLDGGAMEAGRSGQDGGAIYLSPLSELYADGVVITGNEAAGDGGGIYAGQQAALELVGVELSGNTAAAGGGGLYAEQGAEVSARTGRWRENTAGGDGGALLADEAVTLDFETERFEGNVAGGAGGALALAGEGSSLRLFNTILEANQAADGGAVSAGSYDRVLLEYCELTGNQADGDGGGLWLDSSLGDGTLEATSVLFADNLAERGAGISLQDRGRGVDATLSDCEFTGNQATGDGGGLAASDFSDLRIAGGAFAANESGGCGAGAWLSDAEVTFSAVGFSQNLSSGDGGGLCAEDDAEITLDASRFEGNSAAGDGGGAALSGTLLEVTDGLFSGNDSGGAGGGLHLSRVSAATLSETRLVDNVAGTEGGGLYAYAVTYLDGAHLEVCTNEAADGGGVYLRESGSGSRLANTVLLGNAAERYGGGLAAVSSSALEITNAAFAGNEAAVSGAAVFANSVALDFVNNAVVYHTGSEALSGNSETLESSSFAYSDWYNNVVGSLGGALVALDLEGDGNFSEPPGFRDYTAGDCDSDLRLDALSDLRDAGDPALLDPDGSRSDVGAYGGPGAEVEDSDGDGWAAGEDCDDSDPDINPGAEEVWYDGVDQDCDGADDYDADGDGHVAEEYGGADCDDTDGGVYPGAYDPQDDGVDSDCDGWDGEPPLADDTADTGDPPAVDTDTPPSEVGSGKRCSTSPAGAAGLWLLALALARRAGTRRWRA